MHAAFNGLSVTALFLASRSGNKISEADMDDKFSMAAAIIGVVVVSIIAIVFYINNKKKNNQPGEEILLPGYDDPDNPSWTEVDSIGNKIS